MNDPAVYVLQSDLPLETKLERARMELLDLSARNRLLNVPRFSKAAKTVEIIDERSWEVFRLLVREGKAFTFGPGRESKEHPDTDDEAIVVDLPQPEGDEPHNERGVAARHSDTKLQTRMTSKGLQSRLLDLYQDARTLEEEQGVNVLYIGLGMLKWLDPQNPANIRHAPLVLVPVRLERGAAGERFRLRWRQEEQAANLSLEAYLDRVHSLRLPSFDTGDDFDIGAYFAGVGDAVSTRTGWEVLQDDIVLGFFSFSKFLMYRDLDPANWPGHGALTEHRLIRSLLADGFEGGAALISEDGRIDDHLSPADMLHVVDCDSSQTLAVHDARSGRDLVIQGPPGTGKSQTIANVIAAAIADGKTVLFVAEKMAALDVVKRRLDTAGVGDACLELHSNKTNKRLILSELKRTWELGSPRGDLPDGVIRRLTEARDTLSSHADRMHAKHDPSGLTPFMVFGHLARLRREGLRPNDVQLDGPERWDPDGKRQREELLEELSQRVRDIGVPDAHPWQGIGLRVIVATSVERLIERIRTEAGALEAWQADIAQLAARLEVQPSAAMADTTALVSLARRVAAAPDLDPAALTGTAWDGSPCEIVALLEVGRECERLLVALGGSAAPGGLEARLNDAIPVLSLLPATFDVRTFERLRTLAVSLPRLLQECSRLAAELGSTTNAPTLAIVARMIATAERVAAAPDASPEAFAATVWDNGVEQAGDLAQAVAALEQSRREIGGRVTDAAWSTDVVAARQAFATHTGFTKRLNGDWRRAAALLRTVLTSPDAPLAETLTCLDSFIKGQAALRTVAEHDAFGRSAFGADWRGDKSSAAPLLALVDWMRTLRGLGAEPRLIAGRVPERSAIGDRAKLVGKRFEEVRADLTALWSELGETAPLVFKDALTPERADLVSAAAEIAGIAEADQRTAAALSQVEALPSRLRLLDLIVQHQRATAVIASAEVLGTAAFGSAWEGARSDWSRLARAAHWIASNPDVRALAAGITDLGWVCRTADAVETGCAAVACAVSALLTDLATDAPTVFGAAAVDSLPAAVIADRLAVWQAHPESLSKWVAYRDRADRARSLGLAAMVDRLQDGRIVPDQALPMFEMAYFEALLSDMVARDGELGRFDGTLHADVVRNFASLDRQRIAASSLQVVRAHHRRIPPSSGIGPVGVLRGEMARRRGHMPIRQLMQKAAPAIQALKPVLMMSPLSVAQFLTPGLMSFDLLVMDEASQIQPVDALGAIARCRQVVVVGDERQLPPTAFFSKVTEAATDDDDDGAQVADIESILGLFVARGLPNRMLRWHYRSRHQSLIAVSNSQFYESKLFIVPSPYTQEAGMGLRFHHVPDGVFDSGGTGTNVIEARIVAEAAIRHTKSYPGLSLGIAAFSSRQRRAIQDELEILRRLNPESEDFFRSHPSEPFFIKNLENVQGDERDVILISVGYARNAQGYMSMRFGPLGADGGERRLNVLISRAKQRCDVFASITDEDIDLERGKGKGVFAFKLFLHYARTGKLALAKVSGRDPDSIFEEQVAAALQARGYQVHPQVGLAGFFIDLAVADPDRPGRYLLGIECDGIAYHSARSSRDRDRLRQAVLEDHGWILHRIWSPDWFQRPAEQLERVIAAIEAAKAELDERSERGASAARAVPVEVVTVEREDVTEIGLADAPDPNGLAFYVEASPLVPIGREMHETPSGLMAELVEQVVSVEGPVHIEEVVTRLRSAWGLQRAGGRIQATVERGVDVAVQQGKVERAGPFLTCPGQKPLVRDRSGVASGALRRPEMLAPAELDAAVMNAVRNSLGATGEEIASTVPRMFGFKSTSAQLRQVIIKAIERCKTESRLVSEGSLLVAVNAGDAA